MNRRKDTVLLKRKEYEKLKLMFDRISLYNYNNMIKVNIDNRAAIQNLCEETQRIFVLH